MKFTASVRSVQKQCERRDRSMQARRSAGMTTRGLSIAAACADALSTVTGAERWAHWPRSLRSHFAVLTHVAVRRVRRGGERNSLDGRVRTRARDLAPVQLPVRRVHLRHHLRAGSAETEAREGEQQGGDGAARPSSPPIKPHDPCSLTQLRCDLALTVPLLQTTCGSQPCGGCRRWWREVLMAATFRLPPRPTARA